MIDLLMWCGICQLWRLPKVKQRMVLLIIVVWSFPALIWGAGAILVDTSSTGEDVVWGQLGSDGRVAATVTYNPETTTEGAGGDLGSLTNAEALDLIADFFGIWTSVTLNDGSSDVSVVSLAASQGTGLGNVDSTNFNDHFTYCPSGEVCFSTAAAPFVLGSAQTGQSPIILDHDGALIDLVQGTGANQSVLGVAGPRVVERIGPRLYITESQAILNGLFIDCPAGAASEAFKGAILHEIGHFLGLDHAQNNLAVVTEALRGTESALAGVATMFPLFINGEAQFSLHYDDKVSIATLYPAAAFQDNFCTIQGTVFQSDGRTPMQGANVVVRRVDNSIVEVTSVVSGAHYTGSSPFCDAIVGDYSAGGLIPNVDYTLEIETISSVFTGGSSIEPCSPPLTDFSAKTLPGTFRCQRGGQVILIGSDTTTDVISSRNTASTTSTSSSGGCSLIPEN
jgi:hypothetical protein